MSIYATIGVQFFMDEVFLSLSVPIPTSFYFEFLKKNVLPLRPTTHTRTLKALDFDTKHMAKLPHGVSPFNDLAILE